MAAVTLTSHTISWQPQTTSTHSVQSVQYDKLLYHKFTVQKPGNSPNPITTLASGEHGDQENTSMSSLSCNWPPFLNPSTLFVVIRIPAQTS